MREMCKFAKCTISSQNFIEVERLRNVGHIMNCGRIEGSTEYNLLAFCVQSSGGKEKPHILKVRYPYWELTSDVRTWWLGFYLLKTTFFSYTITIEAEVLSRHFSSSHAPMSDPNILKNNVFVYNIH